MQVLICVSYQLFLYVYIAKLVQGHMTMHKNMSSYIIQRLMTVYCD